MTEAAEKIEPPVELDEDDYDDGPAIVIIGNPVDGFCYFGPFLDGEVAEQWAATEIHDEDWWVAPLEGVYEEVEH